MLVICCNNFFNGISEYCIEGCVKVMVVCYFGNGVGYIWYVDNLDGDGCCFIVIYYFNQGWGEDSGGKFRIYRENGYVDVELVLNRLLMFWFDGCNFYEVLLVYCIRYVIIIWYFYVEERWRVKEFY